MGRAVLLSACLLVPSLTGQPPSALRMLQQPQQQLCSTEHFSAAAAAVTTDCCGGGGSGHRRLQDGCTIPTSCPTAQCAATFMAFYRDCQQQLSSVSSAAELSAYETLNSDCTRLVADEPSTRRCEASPMRGDICGGNSCKRFVASGMRDRSCAEYCCESGMGCVGAWEELDNGCAPEDAWTCQQTQKRGGGATDDVICECDGDGSTLTEACPPPPAPPPVAPPRPPAAASECCGALPWMAGWLCPGCPTSCLICAGSADSSLPVRPCSALRWGQAWSCASCPASCTITNRPPLPASDVPTLTAGGTTNLPIVLITTPNSGRIPDEPKVSATLVTLDSGPNQRNDLTSTTPSVYEDSWTGAIAIEQRGSSSAQFPKKQWGFETQDAAATGENADVSLLGLPAENDWVLNAPVSFECLLLFRFAHWLYRSD